jgi:hypothetical protein
MSELIKTLKEDILHSRKAARRNYFAAYTLNIIVVGASITAAILATANAPATYTAIFAALPAIVLSINTTFKFEKKSRWHWKKNKRIRGYLNSLEFEGANDADISRAYSKFNEEMDESWEFFTGQGHD